MLCSYRYSVVTSLGTPTLVSFAFSFNLLWYKFYKMLETLLRDFGQQIDTMWTVIPHLPQTRQLHLHDVIFLFHHIKRLCGQWRPFETSEQAVMFEKPSSDDLSLWHDTLCQHHQHKPQLLIKGRIDPFFHIVYTNIWPCHSNGAPSSIV